MVYSCEQLELKQDQVKQISLLVRIKLHLIQFQEPPPNANKQFWAYLATGP